jgi:hypothetical protein
VADKIGAADIGPIEPAREPGTHLSEPKRSSWRRQVDRVDPAMGDQQVE